MSNRSRLSLAGGFDPNYVPPPPPDEEYDGEVPPPPPMPPPPPPPPPEDGVVASTAGAADEGGDALRMEDKLKMMNSKSWLDKMNDRYVTPFEQHNKSFGLCNDNLISSHIVH